MKASHVSRPAAVSATGPWHRLWVEYVKPIGLAVLLALLIRQFVAQAFRIPTGSMEKTLLVGDFLFANKFVYGAKTPDRIRIPLVNWTLVDNLPVLKLPALRQPRQGDIIVFEYPLNRHEDYIKRCVAVAGDRVLVRDGKLLVNGKEYEDNLNHPDQDTSMRPPDFRVKPHTLHDPRRRYAIFNDHYGLAEALGTRVITPRRAVQYVSAALAGGAGLDSSVVMPHLEALRHHVDGTHPLEIVRLRQHLQALRASAAQVDAPFVVPPGTLFMMGDNRYNSADSRFWGPLDTSLIKGKAMFLYWSWNKERNLPRLNRIGHIIR